MGDVGSGFTSSSGDTGDEICFLFHGEQNCPIDAYSNSQSSFYTRSSIEYG